MRLLAAWSLLASVSSLASAADALSPSIANVITKHCIECHQGDDAQAGLRLDQLHGDWSDRRQFTAWVNVFDRVAAGEMPPSDAAQPTVEQRRAMLTALREPLVRSDLEHQRHAGRTVLRRLNRVEYENTLRDLLALPNLAVKDMLPADAEQAGFDTVGEVHSMSYVQQDAYLRAAEAALESAVTMYPQPPEKTFRAVFAEPPPARPDRVYPPMPHHRMVLTTNANLDPPQFVRTPQGAMFVASADGMYHLRFRARGLTYDNREQAGGQEGKVTPAEVPHVILLYAERPPFSRWLATFDLPRDRMGELQLNTWLGAGERIRRIYASVHESGMTYRPYEKPFFGTAIGMESFEARGPLYVAWPPESHRRVLGDVPLKELSKEELLKVPVSPLGIVRKTLQLAPIEPTADAARLIAEFVPRALRRQVKSADIERYGSVADRMLADGTPFKESLFAAYQATLCSPDFLYFQERPGQLDGEALANRLSYFLWRSMPDEALLQAGREGQLHDERQMRAQVERLLNDSRAERFIDDFTDQWLKLREIAFTQPDADLYPEYNEDFELLDSLLRETRAYFTEMVRRDLGVEFIVDSDFVFVNRALAQLYGIEGVEGTHIRKVELPPGHIRGGLLTQASVLKVTANGTTTSPVTRGVWLMDRILGSPPPAPPADVPAVEPDTAGATTIREQLAKHRQIASCAMCHKKIDPPGFALECFDVMGGYRTHYRAVGVKPLPIVFKRVKVKYGQGMPADAHGETETGEKFAGLSEYQQILLRDQPRLARNLVERLVTYSTGAAVQFADRDDVEQIVRRLKDQHYGVRAMIHEVVQSRMFQNK